MRYKCTEKTFYKRIYDPGDEYEAIPDEEKFFKKNPCWEEMKEPGPTPLGIVKAGKKKSGK